MRNGGTWTVVLLFVEVLFSLLFTFGGWVCRLNGVMLGAIGIFIRSLYTCS